MVFLIQGLYSLYSNYITNDCLPENSENEAVCHRDFINMISISNKFKHHDLFIIQSWVNLASMLIVIIILHYYRIFQKKSAEEIDRDNISPSDYTVMIKGFPKGKYDEKIVEESVMDFWNRVPHQEENQKIITKIVIAYDIAEYVNLCREKKKLSLEKRRADHMMKKHGKKFLKEEEIRMKLGVIEEKIRKQEEDVKSGIRTKTCGIAFVSFRTQSSILFYRKTYISLFY